LQFVLLFILTSIPQDYLGKNRSVFVSLRVWVSFIVVHASLIPQFFVSVDSLVGFVFSVLAFTQDRLFF